MLQIPSGKLLSTGPGFDEWLSSVTDPNTFANNPSSVTTSITYDSNGLYPTTVEVAAGTTVQRSFNYRFDSSSGLEQCEVDADNKVKTALNYDNLGRPLSATQYVGDALCDSGGTQVRASTTSYDDVNLGVTVTNPDSVSSTTNYDALGRVRYVANSQAGVYLQKAYRYNPNGSGSIELTSNPYATTPDPNTKDQTTGWALTRRDPAGRTVEVDNYPGSGKPGPWGTPGEATGTKTAVYSGTNSTCPSFNVTVTDEATNSHINCFDGVGRLQSVQEPQTSSTPSPVLTTYTYDILNNIIGVGSRRRPDRSGKLRAAVHGYSMPAPAGWLAAIHRGSP